MFDVIIAAGGSGTRTKFKKNKLLMPLYGQTVLEKAILPFLEFDKLNKIIVATNAEIFEEVKNICDKLSDKIEVVKGGITRTQTVKSALDFVTADYVLIHDGARPFITTDVINRVIEKTKVSGSAVPIIPLEDTLVCTAYGYDLVNRSEYYGVQTPQGFLTKSIKTAYSKLLCRSLPDDSAVYKRMVGDVSTVVGDKKNRKITTADDLFMPICRTGIGFDTHKLANKRKLILGGVEIPYSKGLIGHSDADVLTHAVIDAVLSALGEHDIGTLFPDTDNHYKDISSMVLLDKVIEIMKDSDCRLHNLSATIIAEKPKLQNYIPKIKDIYKNKFDINLNQIGISATTTEGVGDIGKEEAISAMATVALIKRT